MLKKILLGALVAVSTFGVFSISEAHHNNYNCRDNYENYCRGNFYNNGDADGNYGCYGGGNGWCGRGWNNSRNAN